MKRIGILTAGGDTPALNATVLGAVVQANLRKVEVVGFIKGFSSLHNPRVPHVRLNPLFCTIPELDSCRGGTIIGASRDFVDHQDKASLERIAQRLQRLGVEGLICVGGDGTLNGMQALSDYLPTVLAPKTIDNDLGLNYRHEPDEWLREPIEGTGDFRYKRGVSRVRFDLQQMLNYVTPGFATSVFVSASGVQRIRTTAESHRRIAIIEVMGRHSGYLALGTCYGQPDIVLIPESPLKMDRLLDRVRELYELQKHVVIVCAEGVVNEHGEELGNDPASKDPAGNKVLSGAADALREILIQKMGNSYFVDRRRNESAKAAIFTRKVGHTQRGGRPIQFDRFYGAQLGGHAVEMLLQGRANGVSILNWNRDRGFHVSACDAHDFHDRWGLIHPRQAHESFYDSANLNISQTGINYLLPIFTNAIGQDDLEDMHRALFAAGNLTQPYHSVNVDVNKRICYLD